MQIHVSNMHNYLQAHIPHAPPLPENAVYNEWQIQALVTGNLTKKGDINCSSKGSNQHFL